MSEVAQAPQLRFPEFSGEWEEKRFDSLYPTVRNGFVGVATPYYVEEGVPYLQGKNIKSGAINRNGLVYINESFHQKSKKSQLRQNDIVMVQSGHVGECAVITEEFEDTNCHALLVSTPTHDIDSKFYINYFYSKFGRKKIYRITTGNTIKHILSSDLKIQTVSNPSYQEQQKIAAFLTAVDTKIEQLSKKQELLGEYKKGSMQQIFSQAIRFKADDGSEFPEWKERRLGDVCSKAKSGGTPRSTTKEYYDGDIPFLAISDITRQGKYLTSASKKISQLGIDNSASWIVPIDTIIYSMYASVGFVSINKIPLATSQAVINLIVKDGYSIEFIYYHLIEVKKTIHKFIETGTQGNLNAQTVKSLILNIPSLPEQAKIANFLSSIDNKIEQVGKQLDESKQFKKALLQQMFV
jgi:type I restriction enzyme S subunit